jgi:hypothetical protein
VALLFFFDVSLKGLHFIFIASFFSNLLELAYYFLFHLGGNFWEAFKFGLGSLKCPETFLVHQ